MDLNDVFAHRHLLEVACEECRTRTPLDPTLFASRHGLNTRLKDIEQSLVCPSCGSADIELLSQAPHSPRVDA